MILVRPRAWWFNKVPLSVTLVLLLLDGRRFSLGALAVLVLVVLTVCAVGTYGYALNELVDVEEDARLDRANAAASAGPRRMWEITAASALCAELFAGAVAGVPGAVATALGLCLPLAYSVPPIRIKERKWLGVCADSLAAHVYAAVLALLAVTHWALRPVTAVLAVCVVLWSVAAGCAASRTSSTRRNRTAAQVSPRSSTCAWRGSSSPCCCRSRWARSAARCSRAAGASS